LTRHRGPPPKLIAPVQIARASTPLLPPAVASYQPLQSCMFVADGQDCKPVVRGSHDGRAWVSRSPVALKASLGRWAGAGRESGGAGGWSNAAPGWTGLRRCRRPARSAFPSESTSVPTGGRGAIVWVQRHQGCMGRGARLAAAGGAFRSLAPPRSDSDEERTGPASRRLPGSIAGERLTSVGRKPGGRVAVAASAGAGSSPARGRCARAGPGAGRQAAGTRLPPVVCSRCSA